MCFFQWWRDVVREREYQGIHNRVVVIILRYRFIIFILSEIFFFISFFWRYFHMILSPALEVGIIWPPAGLLLFDPIGIPLLNSFLLINSGMFVTLSHHYILLSNIYISKITLIFGILYGVIFLLFQVIEYFESSFRISDSVYGSLFYIITGFHGLHVFIGTLFLIYTLYRIIENHFLSSHHCGFEIAAWYWHFVDVVWLFLYVIVYWWSNCLYSINNIFNFHLKDLLVNISNLFIINYFINYYCFNIVRVEIIYF